MPSIYRDLISNVALLLALSTLFNYLTRRWKNAEWPGQVLGGLAFGLMAIAGMITSFRFSEGIIYD
ncbi:MAG TPA: PAS domain-containing sensor histidine kinase, partial [Chloroflexi bacterium]|nr:PAS domain-containing sensor histidine kinase [Chloroflexota bacterium]